MTFTDKHIAETYSKIFEGFSDDAKMELIEILNKSLIPKKKSVKSRFYKSFGAFSSTKDAEDIIADIKKSRKFNKRDIQL